MPTPHLSHPFINSHHPCPSPKPQIPESARESLMSMMKEIMQKSYLCGDQLHYIAEQSVEESTIVGEQGINSGGNSPRSQSSSSSKGQHLPTSSMTLPRHHSSQPQPSSQFSKLLEITQRCVNYYNTFSLQKSSQLQIIEKTFNDLNTNLNLAFQEMVNELAIKQKELKQFLLKKYWEIVKIKQEQDHGLKQALGEIRQVSLGRFTSQVRGERREEGLIGAQEQQEPQGSNDACDSQSAYQRPIDISLQIHNYAMTLNNFYHQMQEIEKSNYKEMVEQSVNFINNLITQEIKVTLYEKIPSRLTEKRMMKSDSKDFLMESRGKSFVDGIQENEGRTYDVGILDVDSFTKLFFDHNVEIAESETKKTETQMQRHSIQLKKCSETNQLVNLQNKKTPPTLTPNTAKFSTQMKAQVSKGYQSTLKPDSKVTFNKKPSPHVVSSPHRKNPQDQQNQEKHQKQTQLDLIKKISSQQNNRSAKIKGYMVTFQHPNPNAKTPSQALSRNKNVSTTKPKQLDRQKSKSPNNRVSKTPTKTSKSAEKKVLAQSVVNNSSTIQQKLRSSQQQLQTSLKSSRNSAYVSEFKVTSSRKQSLAGNK